MASDGPPDGRHVLWLDAFVLANFAGLAPDIYLAHSMNAFKHPSEYVPLYFSLVAAALLLLGLLARTARNSRWNSHAAWRNVGYLLGWAAIAVGVVGLVLHLDSRFFHERTLKSLVYSAPFAAPLAYAGLGLMLIMNRMVDAQSREWPYWVLLFTLGGYIGNFIFSLADHAANGFFSAAEWVPVFSAAAAVGVLCPLYLVPPSRRYLVLCGVVLLLQGGVGLVGFWWHAAADLHSPMPTLFENLVTGAPVLAPLLFTDQMLLGLLGLWRLSAFVEA